MNFEKFTKKSIDEVNKANEIALREQNTQIEAEHFQLALLEIEESLILKLIEVMGEAREAVARLSKVSLGAQGQIYAFREANEILIGSQDEAGKFKDEYVAQEHMFLSLLESKSSSCRNIFKIWYHKRKIPAGIDQGQRESEGHQ
jgi:ATP-dependent Clp protease ATP-binding subunit ClpB